MSSFTYTMDGDRLNVVFSGRIDSVVSPVIQQELDQLLSGSSVKSISVDMEQVDYVASAGLRVLLQLRKTYPDFRIVNVPSNLYEIFEMTGFTEIMEIQKAYRRISIQDCKVIGEGANGIIYQLSPEIIIKTNKWEDALQDIMKERKLARRAFVLGVPTAISFDVVRVGDNYGAAYELLNASTVSQILQKEPDKLDWCAKMLSDLMKTIHSTLVSPDDMPDIKETVFSWMDFLKPYLPEELHASIKALVSAVPDDLHMIHGDYHIKNVMIQNNEALLIDMDTLSHGSPIFELGFCYNAYCGFTEIGLESGGSFLSIPDEMARRFWEKQLRAYLDTDDAERLRSVETKAKLIGYVKLVRYVIRKVGLENERGKRLFDYLVDQLQQLVSQVDTLMF